MVLGCCFRLHHYLIVTYCTFLLARGTFELFNDNLSFHFSCLLCLDPIYAAGIVFVLFKPTANVGIHLARKLFNYSVHELTNVWKFKKKGLQFETALCCKTLILICEFEASPSCSLKAESACSGRLHSHNINRRRIWQRDAASPQSL